MKKKLLFAIAAVAVTAIVLDSNRLAKGYLAGGSQIAWCSGSPGDGGDCTGCHGGGSGPGTATITSNIPTSGYVAGTTYTITAKVTAAGLVKYGFEVSPQTTAGTMEGTLTAGTGSQVISSGGDNYITHTSASTTGTTGSHTWTFTWKAPVAGTGALTFYGSFNCSNNDGSNGGDYIVNATLAVNEHTSGVGVNELSANKPTISLYPNPIKDVFTLEYTLAQTSSVSAKMYDLQGREVAELFSETGKSAGTYKSTYDMNEYKAGMYFVTLSDGENVTTQKVMIAH